MNVIATINIDDNNNYETLGYESSHYLGRINYIYEKNIKLYKCNKNFEFLDDFKKYNSLIKCEDKK